MKEFGAWQMFVLVRYLGVYAVHCYGQTHRCILAKTLPGLLMVFM